MVLGLRLLLVIGIALAAWAAAWALRRYVARARTPQHFRPGDGETGGESPLLVTFTGPYCSECLEIRPRLVAAAAEHQIELRVIDIKKTPELAARYAIRLTPTTLAVAPGGSVQAGWLGTPPEGELEAALGSLAAMARR